MQKQERQPNFELLGPSLPKDQSPVVRVQPLGSETFLDRVAGKTERPMTVNTRKSNRSRNRIIPLFASEYAANDLKTPVAIKPPLDSQRMVKVRTKELQAQALASLT